MLCSRGTASWRREGIGSWSGRRAGGRAKTALCPVSSPDLRSRILSVDYRGRVDVLHVVETFQGVEQPLHARGLVALQDVLGDRLHGDLGERRLQAVLG